jgi:hypothetical protein
MLGSPTPRAIDRVVVASASRAARDALGAAIIFEQ